MSHEPSSSAARADFRPDEAFALELDAADHLRPLRDEFLVPRGPDGQPAIYFCGNSLGLQPRGARAIVEQELRDWADLAVDAHFHGQTPWYSYHEVFRESGARLVGALPGEVVMMNGLTVNLHLMLVTFYRPTPDRPAILMEYPAFPSDMYALRSQLRYHGRDPDRDLIILRPRDGEHCLRADDLERTLREQGGRIALVLLGAVNFFTGQLFDIPRITRLAHDAGCVVGWDLAHAAGNVELRLHDWDVDFAVWCSYKYLNAGPGAVAGCFIHQRHATRTDLPRFGGWWGNDPQTRFRMHLEPEFLPRADADAWQLSNPPILAMAPLRASLDLFDRAGMSALRAKSVRLTGYLQYLIDRCPPGRFEVITPRDPAQRGCQLSILVHQNPRGLQQTLQSRGVVSDFREPNVIRVAPVPLYNTFHEVWRFARILAGDNLT